MNFTFLSLCSRMLQMFVNIYRVYHIRCLQAEHFINGMLNARGDGESRLASIIFLL